ncbi:Putative fructokinase [Paraliobacillus sp. PM-2]|uniref:ROK family protein n=1 Tax=Paraliobacillus sp. PM-2 TaxID=1462524 RepID=UPI00061C0DEA|nr:ROK family protein [Paraliobacillus sp. PM-2]CQR46350.1 Putative fructokinase [Paraliobacillus sp. PM-2]
MYYGGIEAGGTKFVCAVSNEQFEIIDRISIPTTIPEETLKYVFDFFDQYNLNAIGIGSFGPIDVMTDSATYGYVTSTPKKGWNNYNFVGTIKERYNIPVAWTTDVNAAAYGEYRMGSAQNAGSCIYLTIGTGIGGGAILNGEVVEGFGHPEMGHISVRKHAEDPFEGVCPYHGDCLEGIAAGPAIEKRLKQKGKDVDKNDPYWDKEAYYIAQALVNYTMILRPEVIILGGGVMKQAQLFPLIRTHFKTLLNEYLTTPDLDTYITSPGLVDNAGITGSLLLAAEKAI